MCGIVAYKGHKNCHPILLNGLKRLEYRGYDSAGIACINSNDKLVVTKRKGKVSELKSALSNSEIYNLGIAHTRWATHGKPNQLNAHPHLDQSKKIALVHNGIIENYDPIKKFLLSKKIKFKSETDTEVLVQLIGYFYNNGKMNFEQSVRAALQRVDGAYGIVILNTDYPDMMIAARKGSPLVLGIKENEFFIASDISPIVKHTKDIIYLKDSEMAVVSKKSFKIKSVDKDISLPKNIEKIDFKIDDYDKGKYKYFMHKEIHEQINTIPNTINGRIKNESVLLQGLSDHWNVIESAEKIYITACGTSWHAGLIGKNFIERFANIPVHVEYASEFRYNHALIDDKTVVIAISQSGETADTLAAIRKANNHGALTIGICNIAGSSVSRETECGVYTRCGHEVGVASTKAFTSQIVVLYLLALKLAESRKTISKASLKRHLDYKKSVNKIKSILKQENDIKKIALKYKKANDFLYLGRGLNFPVALEGALKLKEISYIHAEGYASGEMKHGPIALVDDKVPVVIISPKDFLFEKNISNMQEIMARGGKVLLVTDKNGEKSTEDISVKKIVLPNVNEFVQPILYSIPMQLIAYFVAVKKGTDVDQPRNLAKSVTVE